MILNNYKICDFDHGIKCTKISCEESDKQLEKNFRFPEHYKICKDCEVRKDFCIMCRMELSGNCRGCQESANY